MAAAPSDPGDGARREPVPDPAEPGTAGDSEPGTGPDDELPRRPDDGPTDEEVDRRFAELAARLTDPVRQPPAGPGPRDHALADEPDEPFEPPEPASLDGVDRISLLGWIGAVGGPVGFLLVLLAWSGAPSVVWLTLLAATLAGWAVVLWRLPRSRDGDDDGAVV